MSRCPPGGALLDSATTHFVSRVRGDFSHISSRGARLTGATGAGGSAARLGRLRENRLGIESGVFFAGLPVDRLVSGPVLNELGWSYLLPRTDLHQIPKSADSSNDFSKNNEGETTGELICHEANDSHAKVWRGLESVSVVNERGQIPIIHDVFGGNTPVSVYMCADIEGATCLATKITGKRTHQRACHFQIPGAPTKPCSCEECLLTKAPRAPRRRARPEKYKAKQPLYLLAADFFGKIRPVSIRGHNFVFVTKCDACKWGCGVPITNKAEAPSVIRRVVEQLRKMCACAREIVIVQVVHTDNEPILRGKTWAETLASLQIFESHSVPYVPTMNSQIERWIRTIKDSLRAVLAFVDKRLWCFAVEHVTHIWTLLPRLQNDGTVRAPADVLRELAPMSLQGSAAAKLEHARRFGCLCFFKIYPTEGLAPLDERRRCGVHLGFSRANSAYLAGCWSEDARRRVGDRWKFTVYETIDVVFREDIPVQNIDQLKPPSNQITTRLSVLDQTSRAVGDPRALGQAGAGRADSLLDFGETAGEKLVAGGEIDGKKSTGAATTDTGQKRVPEKAAKRARESVRGEEPSSDNETSAEETNEKENADGAKRATRGKATKSRRKRQEKAPKRTRADNTKQQTKRKIQRPKKLDKKKAATTRVQTFLTEFEDYDPGEEIEGVEVFLSSFVTISEAMTSGEKERWLEAIDKERLKLMGFECWRKMTDAEEGLWRSGAVKAVPMAIILSKKRCGTYKARAVALGNRWQVDEPLCTYSSTISGVGQRFLLGHCAANGMTLQAFDISNAYIRALIDRFVVVKIPELFREGPGDNGLRTLLKALYGLPISGRLWAKTINRFLAETGWEECLECPGIWKRQLEGETGELVDVFISVYVDDCLCCSVSPRVVEVAVRDVFARFEGTFIKPDTVIFDGIAYDRYDILGCDVLYSRGERRLRIVMARFIDKLARKFNVTAGRPVTCPTFEESALYEEKSPRREDFDFRSAVGSLQWAATAARPDIQFAVTTLARVCSLPCTKSMARCAVRVMRYLVHTRDTGVSYSPAQEAEFERQVREMVSHPENAATGCSTGPDFTSDLHTFSDASFASTFLKMQSVAGTAVYFRSMAVAWKTQAISIRCYATSEAEYSAAAASLQFTRGLGELRSFLTGRGISERDPLWADNRTAILTAKHARTDLNDIRAKSRHYALRHLLVADNADRLGFCPTDAMRADALTKFTSRAAIRNLVGSVGFLIFVVPS